MNKDRFEQNGARAVGFTLVEIMIVVVIMAILASVLVPAVNSPATSQLRGAAMVLARDIQFVQSEALNTGQTLQIEFTGPTAYRVIDPDGGAGGSSLVLPHPQTDYPAHNGQYIVDWNDPGVLRGVTVASAQFGGQPRLEFGRFGETISGGEVILRVEGRQVRISVAPITGLVTIGDLERAP